MIKAIIHYSIHQRAMVLMLSALLAMAGAFSLKHTAIDAIPDLSDVQVIIKTHYPGQTPQLVQDQISYPLSSAMLSVPGAKTVRSYSFYGDSFVYVIFDDQTDIYWARSRVLESLSQAASQLPPGVTPELGPDASGVGWVYIYALRDTTGRHDLSQLRSLQDWLLKFELQAVAGVAEVATVGGMVKQYQIQVDPLKLRAFNMPLSHVRNALHRANSSTGASVIEMAEAEYMISSNGYLQSINDIENIPLGLNAQGTPLRMADIATVQMGPQMRRGISELNGEGEVSGGIIVMRHGENAQQTIDGVKQKLAELKKSLPKGVEIVPVYDRSALIKNSVDNLWSKLGQELLIITLVCAVFLFHLRSALVAVITLPLGILVAFLIMQQQGINANIMSLGGIAIALGAMTDGAIVMIENMHKHLEKQPIDHSNRWRIVAEAAEEVGPALFFSLLIITVSFVPVFILEAQEGRLFAPLAYTKTYAMAAAAGLAITLTPVLMGYFIKGKIRHEDHNPINKALKTLYLPVLKQSLNHPKLSLMVAMLVALSGFYPLTKTGSEFMPDLDEGDLMYMPSTYPGISIAKAREILQHSNRLIKTVPEVQTVFGKVGRAETATDPAPLTMIETFIQLKPKSQWRPGLTTQALKAELNQRVMIPGLSNAWVMPIKTRIDMLATGIKTPLGIKVSGPDLQIIQNIGQELEQLLGGLENTASVYSERSAAGRYIDIDIHREKANRYGLNIDDIQQHIAMAVGGVNLAQTLEGQERYPINLRYPQSYRDSPERLASLPIITEQGLQLSLADVANITITSGPGLIKSENARISGWTFIDLHDRNFGEYVANAKQLIDKQLSLPAGYSISWAGQYEYLERAKAKLSYIVPFTLAIIVLLLFFSFRRFTEVIIILATLPMAMVGGLWLLYAQGYYFSVAVGVGFIALAGVAVEIGVIMLVYLNQSFTELKNNAQQAQKYIQQESYIQALINGAVLRLRPVVMTVATIVLGLLPVMYGGGSGSELMSRIAAPMVGGMSSALLMSLVVLPATYALIKQKEINQHNQRLASY